MDENEIIALNAQGIHYAFRLLVELVHMEAVANMFQSRGFPATNEASRSLNNKKLEGLQIDKS